MKITETQLRRIIAEEAKKLQSRKSIKETRYGDTAYAPPGLSEPLYAALENYLQEYIDNEAPGDEKQAAADACDALVSEVTYFCQSFKANY